MKSLKEFYILRLFEQNNYTVILNEEPALAIGELIGILENVPKPLSMLILDSYRPKSESYSRDLSTYIFDLDIDLTEIQIRETTDMYFYIRDYLLAKNQKEFFMKATHRTKRDTKPHFTLISTSKTKIEKRLKKEKRKKGKVLNTIKAIATSYINSIDKGDREYIEAAFLQGSIANPNMVFWHYPEFYVSRLDIGIVYSDKIRNFKKVLDIVGKYELRYKLQINPVPFDFMPKKTPKIMIYEQKL